MTTTTPRLGAPLLAAAQAQKHVTHNEALETLDALIALRLNDRDLSAPPSSPADGDAYLVKATATGVWATHDGKIAYALDGAWNFAAPFAGLTAYVADENDFIVFTGSAWIEFSAALSLQNIPLLGINATADSTNKLTVASAAILFNNVGAGVQAKLNKHAAGDTASLLYQTNFSGRAELGLTGDDDLHIKVSPDGASWFEAIKADRSSGLVTLAGDPTSALHAATKQYADRARHTDNAGSLTITNAYFGEVVRIDATSGAVTVTLPASATADDWIAIRKKDSSSNRVTVQNSAGTDIAWLSTLYDQCVFAWWGSAWVPVWWNIAPLKQVFTASGTYTKAPLMTSASILAIGSGAGGGSGQRVASGTISCGGGGGSSGAAVQMSFQAAALSATETVTIGAGGSGAAAIATDSTNGGSGNSGGVTSFGAHLVAASGNGGVGGTSSGGAGGAAPQSATNFGTANAGQTSAAANLTAASPGMIGAGGAGGSMNAAGTVRNAGDGGAGSIFNGAQSAGGTHGATGAAGSAPAAIPNTDDYVGGGGGGGGGASNSGAAGAGGAGGAPGGGGGGGGASLNGSASGAGGAGARGEIRITTFF